MSKFFTVSRSSIDVYGRIKKEKKNDWWTVINWGTCEKFPFDVKNYRKNINSKKKNLKLAQEEKKHSLEIIFFIIVENCYVHLFKKKNKKLQIKTKENIAIYNKFDVHILVLDKIYYFIFNFFFLRTPFNFSNYRNWYKFFRRILCCLFFPFSIPLSLNAIRNWVTKIYTLKTIYSGPSSYLHFVMILLSRASFSFNFAYYSRISFRNAREINRRDYFHRYVKIS